MRQPIGVTERGLVDRRLKLAGLDANGTANAQYATSTISNRSQSNNRFCGIDPPRQQCASPATWRTNRRPLVMHRSPSQPIREFGYIRLRANFNRIANYNELT